MRYFAESEYSCPGSAEVFTYYSVSGIPHVIFNGEMEHIGASENTGEESYLPIINSYNYLTSPVKITIENFNSETGEISVNLELINLEENIESATLVLALMETEINSEKNIVRCLANSEVSLNASNSEESFTQELDISLVEDLQNLEAVVFLQADDHHIFNINSTLPKPDYAARFLIESAADLISSGSSAESTTTPLFQLINMGLEEEFMLNLIVDEASAEYSISGMLNEVEFGMETTITLATEEFLNLETNVTLNTPGTLSYHYEVSSLNLAEPEVINFTYLTSDADIILVDADDGADYEAYFTSALQNADYSYSIWNHTQSEITEEAVQSYQTIIWNSGDNLPSISAAERDIIRTFLETGGNILLSGQNLSWELGNIYQSPNHDVDFLNNYLHTKYRADNSYSSTILGYDNDPISADLEFDISGGDGADNQSSPDWVQAFDDYAEPFLEYDGGGDAGIRAIHPENNAKIIFLGFGFEGIATPNSRNVLLQNILNWFYEPITDNDSSPLPEQDFKVTVHPNPFNPNTTFSFSLQNEIQVSLEVYNVKGQRVATIANRVMPSGSHQLNWNGTNNAGQPVSSGIYFFRLTTDKFSSTHKMLLMK